MIYYKKNRSINKNRNNGNNRDIYVNARNEILRNRTTIEKIKSFKIPPAWTHVEINPNSNKIVVTGYDIKGKKQYIYSNRHVENKSYEKFCELLNFGKNIPKIKRDIVKKLGTKKLTKDKMIALIIKIILICNFRIGTETCKKNNNSYGISTLIKKQITFESNSTTIEFVGKKGVINKCKIRDGLVNSVIRTLYNSRKNNEEIFKISEKKSVTFLDVNNFLKKYDPKITTKDFRTWAANTIFLNKILKEPISNKITNRKRFVRDIIKHVADKLHHTTAVCKKKYLLNTLVDLYIDKPEKFKRYIVKKKTTNYEIEELTFMKYLKSYCRQK